MNSKWTSHALPLGLLLLVLPMPAAAGLEDVYVIPRLVAGDIDENIYTPKLSFKNLSNKQCDGKFQLLEGDFKPAGGVLEFNGTRISDGILLVSLPPGEGLSGKLKKTDGGYTGFGIWSQDGACVAGQDVVLTADVEVGKAQADNQYVIVDQIGLTASSRPSQRWGFAVRKEGTAESGNSTAVEVQSDPGECQLPETFQDQVAAQLPRLGHTQRAGLGQCARDGHYVRQLVEPQDPFDHGIVFVVLDIPEAAKAQDPVHHEQECGEVMPEDGSRAQVREAGTQAFLQLEMGEEVLENDQAGEWGQCLVGGIQQGPLMDPALDFRFVGLHVSLAPGRVLVPTGIVYHHQE